MTESFYQMVPAESGAGWEVNSEGEFLCHCSTEEDAAFVLRLLDTADKLLAACKSARRTLAAAHEKAGGANTAFKTALTAVRNAIAFAEKYPEDRA